MVHSVNITDKNKHKNSSFKAGLFIFNICFALMVQSCPIVMPFAQKVTLPPEYEPTVQSLESPIELDPLELELDPRELELELELE